MDIELMDEQIEEIRRRAFALPSKNLQPNPAKALVFEALALLGLARNEMRHAQPNRSAIKNASGYLEGARFANYSGQIVEQKDGKDHLIICDLGCTCGEVESKNANEYAEVLVTLLNAALDPLALEAAGREG